MAYRWPRWVEYSQLRAALPPEEKRLVDDIVGRLWRLSARNLFSSETASPTLPPIGVMSLSLKDTFLLGIMMGSSSVQESSSRSPPDVLQCRSRADSDEGISSYTTRVVSTLALPLASMVKLACVRVRDTGGMFSGIEERLDNRLW